VRTHGGGHGGQVAAADGDGDGRVSSHDARTCCLLQAMGSCRTHGGGHGGQVAAADDDAGLRGAGADVQQEAADAGHDQVVVLHGRQSFWEQTECVQLVDLPYNCVAVNASTNGARHATWARTAPSAGMATSMCISHSLPDFMCKPDDRILTAMYSALLAQLMTRPAVVATALSSGGASSKMPANAAATNC